MEKQWQSLSAAFRKKKIYSCLRYNNDESKKGNGTKKVCHEKKIKFEDHKLCLKANEFGKKS